MFNSFTGVEFNCRAACKTAIKPAIQFAVAPRGCKAESTLMGCGYRMRVLLVFVPASHPSSIFPPMLGAVWQSYRVVYWGCSSCRKVKVDVIRLKGEAV